MPNRLKVSLEDIFKPIDSHLKNVDEAIPEILKTKIPLMDMSSLHLFKKGGKKIRASLVILSSGLNGEIPNDIIDIAAAVEIFHGATLIHDDIIDQAFLRRGNVSVSSEWGSKVAVLIGDFMHVRALQTILGNGKSLLVDELLAAALDMFKGEIYQIEFSGIDVINKDHYFKIIELKTAIFMGTCAKLGAMKAEMPDKERDNLFQFGLNLGRAFQIIDDTFDYVEEDIIGKDTGNDFRNGKITLPLLYLLETISNEEKEMLINSIKSPSEEAWDKVKLLIKKNKAIGHCMDIAEGYMKKALPFLDAFPASVYKEKLVDLAGFLIDRVY
ncbi:MAG: polyprenyl synthetase family protein [Spirochaetes bacterium]|nr:polyprenyl synthetase family protein [Spirochaetota bacterium]